MRKSLDDGKGVFLSHEELRKLYLSNTSLPWDAIDPYVLEGDDICIEMELVKRSPCSSFSEADIDAFNMINDTLQQLEYQLKHEVGLQLDILNNRLSDTKSWISDFEVELSIQFYLKKTDPRYNDNTDNIIFEEKHLLPRVNPRCKNGIDEWFTDFLPDPRFCRYTKILKKPICELFHTIFDTADFPEAEVQNTDRIWVDIIIMPQMDIPYRSW